MSASELTPDEFFRLLLRKEKADALERTMWVVDYLLPYHRVHSEDEEEEGIGPAFHRNAVSALETLKALVAEAGTLAAATILSESLQPKENDGRP